jgi:hypothetical protein
VFQAGGLVGVAHGAGTRDFTVYCVLCTVYCILCTVYCVYCVYCVSCVWTVCTVDCVSCVGDFLPVIAEERERCVTSRIVQCGERHKRPDCAAQPTAHP